MPGTYSIYSSSSLKSHIIIINQNIKHTLSCKNFNSIFVNINLQDHNITIAGIYCPPKGDYLHDYPLLFQNNNKNKQVLILGDFNAHSHLWGYNRDDDRGNMIIDLCMANNFIILNQPDCLATFEANKKTGRPDLSLISQEAYKYFKNWKVLPYLFGDHRSIVTEIDYTIQNLPKRRYHSKIPLTKFISEISNKLLNDPVNFENIQTIEEFDSEYKKFLDIIINSANKTLTKRNSQKPIKFTWWSPTLRSQRNKLNALFKITKLHDAPQGSFQKYKKERALYQKAILKAKKDAWIRFCRTETNPFGKTKKLAFDKFQDKTFKYIPPSNQLQPPTRSEALYNLTEEIFGPSLTQPITQQIPINDQIQDQPLFTIKELRQAIFTFNKNKAPGPDEIDHNMIRAIFQKHHQLLLKMYNCLLKLNYFPAAWKEGELVYFLKEGKPPELHTSYRPITLLPILGKIYEKLILKRINFYLHTTNVLSGLQHGFTDQHSTETALNTSLSYVDLNKQNNLYTSFISLDFQGAFDNLPWNLAIDSLYSLGIPKQLIYIIISFLNNRSARVDWLSPLLLYFFTKGCPQGSCLGPFLWLALLETLLKYFFSEGCTLVAYADDLLLIVKGTSRSQLEERGNAALKLILDWAIHNNIQISIEKSASLTFGKTHALKRDPIFKLNNVNIKSKTSITYLGIQIDQQLNFLNHLKIKRQQINKITQNLYKYSSISGRLPSHFFKIWYTAILQRQLAYGCPVWFPRMWKSHGIRHLQSAQRSALLLMTRAYRNTSTNALQILTGLPPIDLQLEMESVFARTTRLGISSDNHFSPLYFPKCSKNSLNPLFDGLQTIKITDYKGDIIIYTDGSKSDVGTGAAFIVKRQDQFIHSWRARLSHQNSIFQAELCAIDKAIDWCEQQDDQQLFLIQSDSLSSLMALNKLENKDFYTNKIQQKIYKSSKTFYFGWVKGHMGLEGNEKADELAKSAVTDDSLPYYFLPYPSSFLKQKLKKQILQKWQDRWDYSEVGQYTRKFFPTVSIDRFINNRSLILFFTNHGPFKQHLSKFNKSPSPYCICNKISNSLHYILDCTLTSTFHVKKARSMSLANWSEYLLKRPVLLERISECMRFLECNQFLFDNPDPDLDHLQF